MKKLLFFLLFVPLLFMSTMSFGQSPFNGTWMTKLDTAKFPAKPDKYTVSNNMYECLTCVPKVAVKADGTDQKVSGHPYYDTIAVHVVDASSIEIIEKKEGKTMSTDTETVSSDGNTLTDKFTDMTGTQPVTGEVASTRVSPGPAGSHAVSGSWRTSKVNTVSDNGLTVTYQSSADGLKMSDPNGYSYEAKFDGKDYPMQGDPGHTMVSLKRINDRTIEETDKHDGKVDSVARFTVSLDGKSIGVVINDKRHGVTTSYTMEKKS